MHIATVILALVTLAVANPVPGGVSSAVAPQQSPPPGCSENYDGTFTIEPTNVTSNSKRDLEERSTLNTQLGISLKNGILTDPQGRTGYIASNQQFQFDDPPQAGAIYTAGFSVCQNKTLALGNDVFWYRCLSGSFYNLYWHNDAGQCIQSYLITRALGGSGGPAPVSGSASATTSGTASSAAANSSSSTAVLSSSSSVPAKNATTVTGSSSSSGAATKTKKTTVIGGHTTVQHTTVHPTTHAPNTATSKASQASQASSSSSSSAASGNGAAPTSVGNEVFGLVAGMLAAVVL